MFILALAALIFMVGIPALSHCLEMDRALTPRGGAVARVGALATDYFERNLGRFNWESFKPLITAMFRYPGQRARAIAMMNRDYPGKGDALASGMMLVEAGVQGNQVAIIQIQSIADQAHAGAAEMQAPYAMLRVINESRKAALATPTSEQAFQDEVNRLALEPAESFEQSPYALMKW